MNAPNNTIDAMAAFSPATGSASVLDVCCGSRAMWFDKADARATYLDRRKKECEVVSEGRTRTITIAPDIQCDFVAIPFPDDSFWHVVFDPPHHTSKHLCGEVTSNTQKYYGVLIPGWEEMLAQGFRECFRVLKPNGTLIFKWGSREIPLEQILALTPQKPLYGHKSGKKSTTHWVAFLKPNDRADLPPTGARGPRSGTEGAIGG
jgi:SAM-dependent methyltransferase